MRLHRGPSARPIRGHAVPVQTGFAELGASAAKVIHESPHCGVAEPDSRRTTMAEETYEGSFYCVKCKEKRDAKGEVVVNAKGTKMAKGKCPVCGTNLNRILGKA